MNEKYLKRTIEKDQLFSQYLHMERELRIYLPPHYDQSKDYPVIYAQDGAEFFNFGRIATHATKLILDEQMEPMIIVGVDVNMPMRTEEYSPDGTQFNRYCNFFVHELIPFIEDFYPIDPDRRVLAGDSLGGTVALHLALDFPKEFQQVIALSGAFLSPTQQRLNDVSDLSHLELFMIIGTEETAVKTDRGTYNFLTENRKTKQLLDERNANVHYVEKRGQHIWGFWQNELPDALRYFFT